MSLPLSHQGSCGVAIRGTLSAGWTHHAERVAAMSDREIMDINEAIEKRHSIRSYTDRPITGEVEKELRDLIAECNRESGLSLQLFLDEPQALSSIIGRIGYKNARNYLALIGKDDGELDEKCGYYGEKIVLRATQRGLGSCWMAMGYRKTAISLAADEKLRLIIILGYGAVEGKAHRNRPLEELYTVETDGSVGVVDAASANDIASANGAAGANDAASASGTNTTIATNTITGDRMHAWFERGIRAAQLAPTARNQQKFRFTLVGDTVKAEDTGGILSRVDLGIVKYHFEVAAGLENFKWSV
jgi:nitroreductase